MFSIAKVIQMSKWILTVLFVLVFFGLFTATVSADQEDYKHWADKPPADWQNGALQQSNSEYYEGEVVPHYWTTNKLVPGNTYAFNIYYDYYDPSKACGFDYLAQYNLSRTTTFLDATPTIDNAFSEGHGNFYTAGADITLVSPPTDFGIQRFVTVKFTATAKKAEFYWGLHLSEPGSCCPTCSGAHGWPGASLQSDVRDVPATAGAIMLGGGGSMQINPNAILTASISGYKLDECTGAGLPGWTILLCSDPACTSVLESTTTNASGYYVFSVTPGTYYVHEVLEPGWYQTAPSPQTYYGPLIISSTNLYYSDQNFRNHELLCISGYKRIDGDGDGVGESVPTEPWDITLTNISGYSASTTTDTNGYYEFCGLYADTYTVTETVKSGWTNVTPSSLDVPLTCTNVTDVDFVNTQGMACISGYKIINCDDAVLSDWTIILLDEEDTTIDTTTTNDTGYYEFCNLMPGTYTVCEVVKEGWANVTERCREVELGSSDITEQNFENVPLLCINGTKTQSCDGTPVAGTTITLTNTTGYSDTRITGTDGTYSFCGLYPGTYTISEVLGAGEVQISGPTNPIVLECEDYEDQDFVNQDLLCINGTKFDDCTGEGLEGWIITLTKPDGSIVTDTTDEDGDYSFCGLMPGDYTVTETVEDGWTNVTQVSIPVTLNCENVTGQDFTNQKLLCINGTKTRLCDGTGVSGWTITLTNSSGVVGTDITDENGDYSFCGLMPGEYSVSEATAANWVEVTKPGPITLGCGANSEDNDFVNTELFCINGTKTMECGDTPVPGAISYVSTSTNTANNVNSLTLTKPASVVEGDFLLAQIAFRKGTDISVTAPSGWQLIRREDSTNQMGSAIYRKFVGASETGPYTWSFSAATFSNGGIIAYRGVDPVDPVITSSGAVSTVDSTTLTAPGVVIPSGTDSKLAAFYSINKVETTMSTPTSPSTMTERFFLKPPRTVLGSERASKAADVDWAGNGADTGSWTSKAATRGRWTAQLIALNADAGSSGGGSSTPVAGVTITLTNGTYTTSTITAGDGSYKFCGLWPGTYTLSETLGEGWIQISAPGPVTVGCSNVTNQDFVNQKVLCISGFKFNECNQPLSGWTITLTNGTYTTSTTTSGDGSYKFCGLWPGTYTVSETLKAGWTQISAPGPITLSCENVTGQNFINRGTTSISVTKTANVDGCVAAGDVIQYTIKVCNDGNLPLTNINVVDTLTGTYTIGTLAAGACNTATKSYTVTAADVTSGSVVNTATATGTGPCGNTVTDTATESVCVESGDCCGCPTVPNFSATQISSLTIQFTDTSTGAKPVQWIWNFGDGKTSTVQNPVHSYSSPGSYTVTLYVRSMNCEGVLSGLTYVKKSVTVS